MLAPTANSIYNVYTKEIGNMEAHLKKWGNSLAIRIPKAMLEHAKLREGMPLEIHFEGDSIVITPVQLSLDELVKGIKPSNLHESVDTGPPVGREVW